MSSSTNPTTAEVSTEAIANDWLTRFERALAAGEGAAQLFRTDGWWRDLLAFTWDLRTAHGPDAIATQGRSAQDAGPTGFALAPGSSADVVGEGDAAFLQFRFVFETDVARGEGVARLTRAAGSTDDWRAWTVLTATRELKGHEELVDARRPHGGPQGSERAPMNWAQARQRQQEFLDGEPSVVVIGAGHGGLGVAARLGRLGVDTLVVDRNPRVGDSWRNRYASLVLHDPVWYDHMPYLPFPPNWPVFAPKDKLADWLEFYASAMELNVWTGSEMVASEYDEVLGTWTLTIRRADGTERQVRPRHVVLATGVSGTEPNIPELPHAEEFAGVLCHSSTFRGGAEYAGKKAVVVGTCNSGHDIAQDLHEHGAEVTMVQRSSTYVVDVETSGIAMAGMYDGSGPPTEVADLLSASFPFNALPPLQRAVTAQMTAMDKPLLDRLEKAGFALNSGIDDTGALGLFLQKGGGYYVNVGCSELIADGEIAIRSGIAVERFTPSGVVLTDGSTLEADVVVLATGYHGMLATARRLFGDEVADRCGPVWGLDDEGELRGVWRRSGHPGLWFMGGNLQMARFYGQFLALQITAIEAGVIGSRPAAAMVPAPTS
ncbi:flavin-containing monooxygenase [Blastococcus sp. SYSU D00813]